MPDEERSTLGELVGEGSEQEELEAEQSAKELLIGDRTVVIQIEEYRSLEFFVDCGGFCFKTPGSVHFMLEMQVTFGSYAIFDRISRDFLDPTGAQKVNLNRCVFTKRYEILFDTLLDA